MRRLFVAFGLMGGFSLSPAFAADYDLPILRGERTSSAHSARDDRRARDLPALERLLCRRSILATTTPLPTFPPATAPLVSYSLPNSTLEEQQSPSQYKVLDRASDGAFGGGGFIGYDIPA